MLSLSCAYTAQFVGLLTHTFRGIFLNAVTSPSQVSPMTCFRRKGKSFVHTAPRIKSAVFRFLTGFPCSAEQECVSIYVSGSRICHKVSRIYREPPNGGGSYFAQCRSVPKRSAPGNLTAGRGNNRQSSIKGLCKGDYTNQVIQTHSACFFLASC